jgi:amino acid transporter
MPKSSSRKSKPAKKLDSVGAIASENATAINAQGDINIGGTIHKEKGVFTEININGNSDLLPDQKKINLRRPKQPTPGSLFTFSILFLLILATATILIVWVAKQLEKDILLLILSIIVIVFITVIVALFMASKIISPNAGMEFFNNLINKVVSFTSITRNNRKRTNKSRKIKRR